MFDPLDPPKSDIGKIIKSTFYLFLSVVKASIQSLLLTAWTMVALVFVSNVLEQFNGIKNIFLKIFIFAFIFILVYESIYNFKKIKRKN